MKTLIALFVTLISLQDCKLKKTEFIWEHLPKGLNATITQEIYDRRKYFYQINYEIMNNTNTTVKELKIKATMQMKGVGQELTSYCSNQYRSFDPGEKEEGTFYTSSFGPKPDTVIISVME